MLPADVSPCSLFRFVALNRQVARTEADNGSFAASDICSRIGSSEVISRGQVPVSIGDEGFESAKKNRIGRPLKRPRVEPTIVWAGSTISHQFENAEGQRSLYKCGRDDLVALSLPATRSSTAVVDCRRMTYSCSRSTHHVVPHLGPLRKEQSDGSQSSRLSKAEARRQLRRAAQLKDYAELQWSKLPIDGVLEVASSHVDGMPPPAMSSSHTATAESIEHLQKRLLSDRQAVVGELYEPNAELMLHVSSLCGASEQMERITSAVRCLIGTRQHDERSRQLPKRSDGSRHASRAKSEEYSTSATQTIATASSAGCFACLLPQFERRHLRTDRAAKSNSQAELSPIAIQTLARPYLSSDRRRQKLISQTETSQSSFRFFWKHCRALGVIKTPHTSQQTSKDASTSLKAKIRSATADYSFALAIPGTVHDDDQEFSYVEAVAAYNQLVSSSRLRGELLLRIRALKEAKVAAVSIDEGHDDIAGQHSEFRGLQSEVSVHSTSLTAAVDVASSHEPIQPFLDARLNSRDLDLPNVGTISFSIDPTVSEKYVRSLHPGEEISGYVIEEWTNMLLTLRRAAQPHSTSTHQHDALPVKVLSYLTSQWYTKKSALHSLAPDRPPIKLPEHVLSMSDVLNSSIDIKGEGLWQPLYVDGGHWIVVAFFANFNKTLSKCKPTLEVYDTLGARTSDEKTLQAINAAERMLRATISQATPAVGGDAKLTSLAQSILGVPWRIRFVPEASMTGTNDCGLICMQRLTLVLLPHVPVEHVSRFVTRKSIEYVLFAAAAAASSSQANGSARIERLQTVLL
jgi:hypothetical protein